MLNKGLVSLDNSFSSAVYFIFIDMSAVVREEENNKSSNTQTFR